MKIWKGAIPGPQPGKGLRDPLSFWPIKSRKGSILNQRALDLILSWFSTKSVFLTVSPSEQNSPFPTLPLHLQWKLAMTLNYFSKSCPQENKCYCPATTYAQNFWWKWQTDSLVCVSKTDINHARFKDILSLPVLQESNQMTFKINTLTHYIRLSGEIKFQWLMSVLH